MRLNDLLALSHVPRWSTVRHTARQSVADHTYRTLAIYIELCERTGTPLTTRGVIHVLCHDGTEAWTGDIPGNFKRRLIAALPTFHNVENAAMDWRVGAPDERENLLLTIADRIEAYTFIRSWGVGAHAERVQQRAWIGLSDFVKDTEFDRPTRDIVRDIQNESERD